MQSDIVERLRAVLHNDRSVELMNREAAAEITRLRAELVSKADELAAMRQQRDEARRDACLWALPQGVEWNEAMIARGKAIASERGWDCFAKEGGGA